MRSKAHQTHENRTITVDFQNEATYMQLLGDGNAQTPEETRRHPVPAPSGTPHAVPHPLVPRTAA